MEHMFERMSACCKYYEPGMPVYYEKPGGQCLYYGRAGANICKRGICPLLEKTEKESKGGKENGM